jgi:streptogramin lyase
MDLPFKRIILLLLAHAALSVTISACGRASRAVVPAAPAASVTTPAQPAATALLDQATSPQFIPAQSQIRARIALPPGVVGIAVGDGSLWISNAQTRTVSRIDPRTQEPVVAPIALDVQPADIAYGEGAVWVCSADRTSLTRIDPHTNQVAAVIDLSPLQLPTINHFWVAAGEGAVWLVNETSVIQIDPQTNQVVGHPIVAGEEIIAIALGEDTFWTGSHDDGIITRIDARAHQVVTRIDVGFAVHGLAVGEGSAWVLDEHGFAVAHLDPATNQIGERVPINFVGANLATGAGSVWVAPAAKDSGRSTGNDGIARIDSEARTIMETVHVGEVETSQYYKVMFAEGSAWVYIDVPEAIVVQIAPSPALSSSRHLPTIMSDRTAASE